MERAYGEYNRIYMWIRNHLFAPFGKRLTYPDAGVNWETEIWETEDSGRKMEDESMHDRQREHENEKAHVHGHEPERVAEVGSAIVKLRKMVQHWISHNEEHARSYRLWASRAREAGCEEPGAILEEIASEIVEQNERFKKIVNIIDSSVRPD